MLIIFIIFLISFLTLHSTQIGIVIVPVADLVGQPMAQFHPHQSAIQAYHAMPWAQSKIDYPACLRLHQLLYHEIVHVIRIKGDEIEIAIPQVYYQTVENKSPQNIYWTLAKNILILDPKKIDLSLLPAPINYKNLASINQKNVVTLTNPFHVSSLSLTLSAGTRFTKASGNTVYILHPTTHTMTTIAIPPEMLYDRSTNTDSDRRKNFIALLRSWANQSGGCIPYVWGGCSFTQRLSPNSFSREYKLIQGKLLGFYERPTVTDYPKTGFDCSGVIVRAAQIVGIPYFYKNTYTITQQLPLLAPGQLLEPGDLMWIRGHIYIIADTIKNTVFEAHAYDGGYGKFHEIPISKVFKNVQSLHDLMHTYFTHKPLERLNDKGDVFAQYQEVKLLKILLDLPK